MDMSWILATPRVEDMNKGDGSQYTLGDYANKMAYL